MVFNRPAVTIEDLRRRARRRLPRAVFDSIDGGADDELTLSRNQDDSCTGHAR